jgi:hypothetical protein
MPTPPPKQIIETAHRVGGVHGHRDVFFKAEVTVGLDPFKIGPNLEMLTVAAQHHHPNPRVRRQSREGVNQGKDNLAVISVMNRRPVNRHVGHATVVDSGHNSIVGHDHPPPLGPGAQRASPGIAETR